MSTKHPEWGTRRTCYVCGKRGYVKRDKMKLQPQPGIYRSEAHFAHEKCLQEQR